MNKRVLLVTEFSQLPTGYGVYSRELLARLQGFGYDVAELACYVSEGDPRLAQSPWKVYPNRPADNSPDYPRYQSSHSNELGEFTFNPVCLHFRPQYVLDLRDPWAFDYQSHSPFRKFFNWIISPTCDASPLSPDWMEIFGGADGVLTYSEFGRDAIMSQGRVNFKGVASPGASHDFYQYEKSKKENIREKHGLSKDSYIIGSVMRNQPRKLFPDLFESFSTYLKQSGRTDVFLYCHTAFPDVGWNIPELLMNYGISNKVYFTYKCRNCSKVTVRLFNDTLTHCHECGQYGCNIAGVGNGLTTKELAEVYNLFDFFVQYAENEGYGMPILEAAQCGLPIACVNYSSMESFVNNIGAIPIKFLKLQKEASTGRDKAVPDNLALIDTLYDLLSLTKDELYKLGTEFAGRARAHYSWDKCAKVWIDAIESIPVKPDKETWLSQPVAVNPAPMIESPMTPTDQATFLITEVLRKPEFMHKQLWRRLVKDLTYRTTLPNAGHLYFNEDYSKDTLKHRPFSFADAYKQIYDLRQFYNIWEDHRAKSLGIK